MNSLAGIEVGKLDEEWITLLLFAKAQGLSPDDVRGILSDLQAKKTSLN